MGRLPSQGKMSVSKRRSSLLAWLGAQLGENFPCHSRATPSKLSAFSSLRAALSALRACPGSSPLSSILRASSLPARASLSVTRGNTPSASRFSFPPCRYLSRHHLLPVGET